MNKDIIITITVCVIIGILLLLKGVLIFKKEPFYGFILTVSGLVTGFGIILMAQVP